MKTLKTRFSSKMKKAFGATMIESVTATTKNSPDRGLRSSPQLDPNLVESHIVVNDSSISNIIPRFIEIGRSQFLANFEVT